MSNLDEQQLVRAILKNDKRAFDQLVARYERLILHIILPMVHQAEDRRDLMQEVFIKIYQGLKSFGFRSKLSTWIGQITYNTALNFVTKRRPITISGDYESVAIPVTYFSPEQEMIAGELEVRVEHAFEKLAPIQAIVIRLFHRDELSLDEISDVVNLPVNTVKSHLFRGRNELKKIILN